MSVSPPRKKRKVYTCSICGKPKKGHVCEKLDRIKPELRKPISPRTPNIRSIASPDNRSFAYDSPSHHAEFPPRPVRFDPTRESDPIGGFRRHAARMAAKAEEYSRELVGYSMDDRQSVYNKLRHICSDLQEDLAIFERRYLSPSTPSSIAPSKVLDMLAAFCAGIESEWHTDDTGLKIVLQDRIASVWETALRWASTKLEMKMLDYYVGLALGIDKNGRIRLHRGPECEELRQIAARKLLAMFESNPTFPVYRSLAEHCEPSQRDTLFSLTTKLDEKRDDHLATLLDILLFEKHFDQLRAKLDSLEATHPNLVAKIRPQWAALQPTQALEASRTKLEQLLVDIELLIEQRSLRSDRLVDAFQQWEKLGFAMPEGEPQPDHYLSLLVDSFTSAKGQPEERGPRTVDITTRNGAANGTAPSQEGKNSTEHDAQQSSSSLNVFDATYRELSITAIVWLRTARAATAVPGTIADETEEARFNQFAVALSKWLHEHLDSINKPYLPRIASHISKLRPRHDATEKTFLSLAALYAACYTSLDNPATLNQVYQDIDPSAVRVLVLSSLEKKCACCSKAEGKDTNKLYMCGRCKSVLYCGLECQRMHWNTHKAVCAPNAPHSVGSSK